MTTLGFLAGWGSPDGSFLSASDDSFALDSATATSAAPAVVIEGAGLREMAATAAALERFDAVGLDLPALHITISSDPADCGGHLGRFKAAGASRRITICSDLPFVIFHELAHVWIDANVDERAQASYLELRDLAVWNDFAVDWADRGIEDAAFVIQQNVMPRSISLTGPVWDDRREAFERLTATPSPLA